MNERGTAIAWLGGGLAVIGLVVLSTKPAQAMARTVPAVEPKPPVDRAWVRRVIAHVSATEGRPDALNRNLDGAGLSFGILQWNQRGGALGTLLEAMQQSDPTAFARIFGPSWAEVLEVARRRSLESVGGARLWEEPWAGRFATAGRHPPFVAVQWHLAEHGEHFRGALDVARILGMYTERSIALFFDRSVQQGPGTARRLAETLRERWIGEGRRSVPYAKVLRAYAEFAASRFRRTKAPPSPRYSARAPHIVWQRVVSTL